MDTSVDIGFIEGCGASMRWGKMFLPLLLYTGKTIIFIISNFQLLGLMF